MRLVTVDESSGGGRRVMLPLSNGRYLLLWAAVPRFLFSGWAGDRNRVFCLFCQHGEYYVPIEEVVSCPLKLLQTKN